MKKTLYILLLSFYSLGTFLLPLGDFSILAVLPEMYSHCKSTEDNDMTPIDFLTDHLINIDCMFDRHEKGDDQKPHQPIQNYHAGQQTVSFITYYEDTSVQIQAVKKKTPIATIDVKPSGYINAIFHPPKFV